MTDGLGLTVALTDDPIAPAGGDINLYSYVGNNPTSVTDVLGLWSRSVRTQITRDAIASVGGFIPREANAIVAGALAMDAWWTPVAWWNRLASVSPFDASHSMPRSDPTESNRIVRQRLRDAICHRGAGEHEAAFHILGQALHTAQDAWAHRYGPVRSGMREHVFPDPDDPGVNPAGLFAARRETQRLLRDFQQGRCKP